MFKDIEQVAKSLRIFEKTFESIRLVDPVKKNVVTLFNGALKDMELNCYSFWGKDESCDNCVSLRAYVENQTYVKIEYSANKVFMVTAIPIELDNRRIAVELIKDATNNLIFETKGLPDTERSEIHAIIDSMNNLTMRDALTGLYNRRFINEKLPIDLVGAALSEKHISVIMADIDHFKNVNDTYGHLTGDCILKAFANVLTSCLRRDSDWVSRFGGEEFIVCLPGADVAKVCELAERMRRTTEQTEFQCGEHTLRITASFGVCSIMPREGDSAETMIDAADKKLYLAKNNGRNRVEY